MAMQLRAADLQKQRHGMGSVAVGGVTAAIGNAFCWEGSGNGWQIEIGTLYRPANGETARLGAVVNRAGHLTGGNILKEQGRELLKQMDMIENTEFKLLQNNAASDSSNSAGGSAQMHLSCVPEVSLEGSAQRQKSRTQSTITAGQSLAYTCRKVKEVIDFTDQRVHAIVWNIIRAIAVGGTHIVDGILWGSHLSMTDKNEKTEKRSDKNTGGSLSAEFQPAKILSTFTRNQDIAEGLGSVAPSAGAGLSATSDAAQMDASRVAGFQWNCSGIQLGKERIPSNWQEFLELVGKAPGLMANDGKGAQQMFRLIPIIKLLNYLIGTDPSSSPVGGVKGAKAIRSFGKWVETKEQLEYFHNTAQCFSCCVQPEVVRTIKGFFDDTTGEADTILSELTRILGDVQSGRCKDSEFDSISMEIDDSRRKILAFLSNYTQATQKIAIARLCEENDVTYVGRGYPRDKLLDRLRERKAHMLFFSQQQTVDNQDMWNANWDLFLDMRSEQVEGPVEYFVVDTDFHPELKKSKICVQLVKGKIDNVLIGDVLEEITRLAPKARPKNGVIAKKAPKPEKTVPFSFSCPAKCGDLVYDWLCDKCNKQLHYSPDGSRLFCDCGYVPLKFMEYRCNHATHGETFQTHDRKCMSKLAKNIRPRDVVNIAVFGEEDAGKTAIIKAISCILQYQTLEDAREGGWTFLGQSSTKKTRTYTFLISVIPGSAWIRPWRLRLIYTPGIGSGRDARQDTRSLYESFAALSNLEDIHGVLVMLKANDGNRSAAIKYTVTKILSSLHRDATKNILFCFTHSRPVNFDAGNSLLVVDGVVRNLGEGQRLLSDQNMFHVDMEWVPYLEPLNIDPTVTMTEKELENHNKSWEKFNAEMIRMLSRVRNQLEPHAIKLSVDVNFALHFIREVVKLNDDWDPVRNLTVDINLNRSAWMNCLPHLFGQRNAVRVAMESKAKREAAMQKFLKLRGNETRDELQFVPRLNGEGRIGFGGKIRPDDLSFQIEAYDRLVTKFWKCAQACAKYLQQSAIMTDCEVLKILLGAVGGRKLKKVGPVDMEKLVLFLDSDEVREFMNVVRIDTTIIPGALEMTLHEYFVPLQRLHKNTLLPK